MVIIVELYIDVGVFPPEILKIPLNPIQTRSHHSSVQTFNGLNQTSELKINIDYENTLTIS